MLFASVGIKQVPTFDVRLFTPTTPDELNQLDALLMPNPPPVPGFVARDILRHSKKNAWVIHRALDSMRTGEDATDGLLPQLKMPVLIVWGDADRILPLALGETMHRLVPQSELLVIPGCGHLAPVQCSAQIGPKVVEFVKR
jgi:pimeloyl-ACP methyl ester carboxylesterase